MPKVKGSTTRSFGLRKVRKPSSSLIGDEKVRVKRKKKSNDVSQRSDSSGSSGMTDRACVTGPADGRKMAAGTFNRDASFDDNQSDIYDDDDDRGFFQMNESDEDTEDASETDMARLEEEFTEMKEQMYQEKVQDFKQQLQHLNAGKHTEYLKRINQLEKLRDERLSIADICRRYEIELVEKEYINEQKAAQEEFKQKKIELKDTLMTDLQEKRKMIESERLSMELTGDSVDVKPAVTRKLRRRPNDPMPAPEKRRKTSPQINYMLNEEEILEDLKALNKFVSLPSEPLSSGSSMQSKMGMARVKSGHSSSNNGSHGESGSQVDARIEDGKLYYNNKWFHKGNSVVVETKENGKYSGTLHSIGQAEQIWIKKSSDSTKVRIYLSSLLKGRFTLRKKSNSTSNNTSNT